MTVTWSCQASRRGPVAVTRRGPAPSEGRPSVRLRAREGLCPPSQLAAHGLGIDTQGSLAEAVTVGAVGRPALLVGLVQSNLFLLSGASARQLGKVIWGFGGPSKADASFGETFICRVQC